MITANVEMMRDALIALLAYHGCEDPTESGEFCYERGGDGVDPCILCVAERALSHRAAEWTEQERKIIQEAQRG